LGLNPLDYYAYPKFGLLFDKLLVPGIINWPLDSLFIFISCFWCVLFRY